MWGRGNNKDDKDEKSGYGRAGYGKKYERARSSERERECEKDEPATGGGREGNVCTGGGAARRAGRWAGARGGSEGESEPRSR
jgi:hypothetical protein